MIRCLHKTEEATGAHAPNQLPTPHYFQACIAGALTKHDEDEGPCPKCKRTVQLADLTPVGDGDGGAGSSASGSGESTHITSLQPAPLALNFCLILLWYFIISFCPPSGMLTIFLSDSHHKSQERRSACLTLWHVHVKHQAAAW